VGGEDVPWATIVELLCRGNRRSRPVPVPPQPPPPPPPPVRFRVDPQKVSSRARPKSPAEFPRSETAASAPPSTRRPTSSDPTSQGLYVKSLGDASGCPRRMRKAKVALARKSAVVCTACWTRTHSAREKAGGRRSP